MVMVRRVRHGECTTNPLSSLWTATTLNCAIQVYTMISQKRVTKTLAIAYHYMAVSLIQCVCVADRLVHKHGNPMLNRHLKKGRKLGILGADIAMFTLPE